MPKFVWITSAIHHLPLALHLRKYRGEKEKEKKKTVVLQVPLQNCKEKSRGTCRKIRKQRYPGR
jgi:hypothetical protein